MSLVTLALVGTALSVLALSPAAQAQTSAQLPVKDATGTTRYVCETADGSGNLTNCVPVGAATCALQTASNASPPASPNTQAGDQLRGGDLGDRLHAGLGIAAVCTPSGNVVLQGSDGSQITAPVGVGFTSSGSSSPTW